MVPIARRMLFTDRRRALLGILGVAVALVMALALEGIFVGSTRQVSRYIDTSPADVFVSQEGIRTMHMSISVLPTGLVEEVASLPGVQWVEPMLFAGDALRAAEGRRPTYVFGYRPGGRGGPQLLTQGTEPGPGELVADDAAAAALGFGVGEEVEVLGRRWRVSGLTTGMTSIINTAVYLPFDDLADILGRQGSASYLLIGADDAQGVAERLRETLSGVEVLTRPRFSAEERSLVRDMATELMSIMFVAALLIGLAVTGLVLYATVLARLHEIGVMKALGMRPAGTVRLVLTQAAWTVASAGVLAVAVTALIGVTVAALTPDIDLVIDVAAVLRTTVAAVLVGVLGALVPLRKVWSVDPATVFRRPA